MRSKTLTRRAFLALTAEAAAGLALAACAQAKPTPAPESEPTTAQQQPTAQPTSAPPVELLYFFGTLVEMPDLPLVQDELNKTLKERINATIQLNPIPYGDYSDKMAVKNAAGEKWDLSYSSVKRNPYYINVKNGVFADLTDALPEFAPKYYGGLNPGAWEAPKVKGRIYGAINQQIQTYCIGPICRKDLAEKYGLDLSKVNQVEDMEPWQAALVEAIAKGEAGELVAPWRQGYGLWLTETLWGLDNPAGTSTPYGVVAYDDQDLKVWNVYDHPQWQRAMKLTKKWFEAGFFPQEQIPDGERDAWTKAGKDAWLLHVAAPGGDQQEKANTGFETIRKIIENPTILATGSIIATMYAVGVNTSSLETCCKYLELVNTDKAFYNLLCKGIEGKHWVWVDQAKEVVGFPEGLDVANHPYNPGTDWMFGDAFNAYYQDVAQVGAWEAQRQLNNASVPSAILGFALDREPIKNELAAIDAAAAEFKDLQFGLLDYDKVLPDLINKYKAAGSDKVVAEMQKQLNEWKATK